ncbi:MAG TPA: phosphotransferase [Ilumatobacteraceae bacterium]|nr:phosphotransferase [Ilumatobacteraceae bacterium]
MVRVGNTVCRPRGAGDVVVEALLVHLEQVGFDGSPRFLGIDDQGRLGRLAAWLRRLHDATTDFAPPVGAQPRRPLPLAGEVWTHGDVGYSNVVYRDRHLVGLIDWEFAAPADRCCDPAALLAVSVRGPRPDVEDNTRRAAATKLAAAAIADGYGMSHEEVRSLPAMAAAVLDDARHFQAGSISDDERLRSAWRSQWLRDNADYLIEP